MVMLLVMWLMFKKPTKKQAAVISGTGPGYIPAFQGFPEVGVSGV